MQTEQSSTEEIGRVLAEERIRRRLAVEDVAEQLRLRREYVIALERGQWQLLPGEVYAQGFFRSYASLLDLNADYLLEQRNSELAGLGRALPARRMRPAMSSSRQMPPRHRSARRISRPPQTMRGRANQRPETLPRHSLTWLIVVVLVLVAGGLLLSHFSG